MKINTLHAVRPRGDLPLYGKKRQKDQIKTSRGRHTASDIAQSAHDLFVRTNINYQKVPTHIPECLTAAAVGGGEVSCGKGEAEQFVRNELYNQIVSYKHAIYTRHTIDSYRLFARARDTMLSETPY